MAITLLHTPPDPIALTQWATRKRWLSPDGDFGYALHALLAEAFDGKAPGPFCYMERQGLLAYSEAPESQLVQRIEMAAPGVRAILGLERARLRPFPSDWPSGKHLGFEVRIRPILRTAGGAERDVYQHLLENRAKDSEEPRPSRETVYQQWLEQRLMTNNAATLIGSVMHGFALHQVIRRPQKAGEDGKRKPAGVTGPDVLFRGELKVGEPNAFHRLIARGIGRHRAFGYGMLLLRPVER